MTRKLKNMRMYRSSERRRSLTGYGVKKVCSTRNLRRLTNKKGGH
tara:strand:- start:962 stop:1096 length:135 start_codon:yes stop_codon:yes gene_type:complete